jgi:hypothetical protein
MMADQSCAGHGGGHTTWTCRTCDAVVYGPPLNAQCSVIDRPAAVQDDALREASATLGRIIAPSS